MTSFPAWPNLRPLSSVEIALKARGKQGLAKEQNFDEKKSDFIDNEPPPWKQLPEKTISSLCRFKFIFGYLTVKKRSFSETSK
jgi:hypothetical protein